MQRKAQMAPAVYTILVRNNMQLYRKDIISLIKQLDMPVFVSMFESDAHNMCMLPTGFATHMQLQQQLNKHSLSLPEKQLAWYKHHLASLHRSRTQQPSWHNSRAAQRCPCPSL